MRLLKTVVPTFSPKGPNLRARKDTFLPSDTTPVDDTSIAFLAVVACHRLDGAATAMAAVAADAGDDTGPSLSVSVGQQPQWQQDIMQFPFCLNKFYLKEAINSKFSPQALHCPLPRRGEGYNPLCSVDHYVFTIS